VALGLDHVPFFQAADLGVTVADDIVEGAAADDNVNATDVDAADVTLLILTLTLTLG